MMKSRMRRRSSNGLNTIEWAEYDNTINIIDGLIIENKIAQLNV